MEFKQLQTLSTELGVQLQNNDLLFTCAESCTGGLLSQSIVSVPGSSAWFGCSFITYSNISKHKILGVSKNTLNDFGAVSEEVVDENTLINTGNGELTFYGKYKVRDSKKGGYGAITAGKVLEVSSNTGIVKIIYENYKANPEKFIVEEEYQNVDDFEKEILSFKLENSFLGKIGKAIEPVIQPIGYDWKIGIAVLSSFAAREVFVGTLSTIYSVDGDAEETIKSRMLNEKDENGNPVFNLASGISLMLFYAFALQCMSTLAIVKKETNSWKWPSYQFIIMSAIAYLVSLLAYQTLI